MTKSGFLSGLLPRALSIKEHLDGKWTIPREDPDALRIGQKRLDRWREHLNHFDPLGLSRRLAWSSISLSEEEIAWRMRPCNLQAEAPVPDWAHSAWEIAQGIATESSRTDRALECDQEPFEDLFLPYALSCQEKLEQSSREAFSYFSNSSKESVCRELVRVLSRIMSYALEHEFSLFRIKREVQPAEGSDVVYRQFIKSLRGGGIYIFMTKYAGLTRSAAIAVNQWRQYFRDLAHRFSLDRHQISVFVGLSGEDILCKELRCSLSDRHDDGATVCRLGIADGLGIYYKPRSLRLENRIATVLSSLCGSADQEARLLPGILDRGSYGWAAEVMSDVPDFRKYYHAAGSTVANAWLLGATDLHDENVVMTEHGPSVVDGEMFVSPIPSAFGSTQRVGVSSVEQNSVLRSGLLPRWLSYESGASIQINGLAGGKNFATGILAQQWMHLNTDRMALQVRESEIRAPNVVISMTHDPAAYCEDLVEGFLAYIEGIRETISHEKIGEITKALLDCSTRFLFRDTIVYSILEQRLRSPKFALTVVDGEIEVERLAANLVKNDQSVALWPLFIEEKRSISQGDVPRFTVPVSGTTWTDPDGRQHKMFSKSGIDVVRENLEQLSDVGVEFQARLIRSAFFTIENDANHDSFTHERPLHAANGANSSVDYVDYACRIGSCLLTSAIATECEDGPALTWIAPQRHESTGRLHLGSLGSSLYDGRAGIGLFFAALARITQQERWFTAAYSVFCPFLSSAYCSHWMEDLDLVRGGAVGRASLAYGLREAGSLLRHNGLLSAAERIVSSLSLEDIKRNTRADWITGLSGEAMALSSFKAQLPDGWNAAVLSRLQELSVVSNGSIHWPIAGEDAGGLGAGHGVAGIAHALSRLFPEDRVAAELISGANRCLHAHWSPLDRNWIHEASRTQSRKVIPDGWAHGAPGIIMTMENALPEFALPAIERLKERSLSDWDTLSMGNSAMIEFWMHQKDFDRAEALAIAMVRRSSQYGEFSVPGNGLYLPGLYDGLAGVGYTVLRLRHADVLPSVLLLEKR